MHKAVRMIIERPILIVLISALLVILCFFGMTKTKINYELTSYLPQSLESVKGGKISSEIMGEQAVAFVIAEDVTYEQAAEYRNRLSEIEGINAVIWLNSFLGDAVPPHILPSAVYRVFRSQEYNSAFMLVTFKQSASSFMTENAIKEARTIHDGKVYITGTSVINNDIGKAASDNTVLYVSAAIAAIFVVLALFMRSAVKPILILLSLGVSIVYNMGTNIFSEISFVTQSIAGVLQLGVTLDYSVFLCDSYENEKNKCNDPKTAMYNALLLSFRPIAGSGLTTFFGFLALCFMSFGLGVDIGSVMAKGVALGVITSMTLLPSMLILSDKYISKSDRKSKHGSGFGFNGLFEACLKKRRIITTAFFVILVAFGVLKDNTKLYYDLMRGLPQNTESVTALKKIQEEYGINTVHIAITDKNISETQLSSLCKELKNTQGVTAVISAAGLSNGFVPLHILPNKLISFVKNESCDIIFIISEFNSAGAESNSQVDEIRRLLSKYDPSALLTGEGALARDTASVTDKDFTLTGILAVISVFLIAVLIFRSVKIPFLIVCTVECAVFINIAIPALTGNEIPFIAPAIINCVQLGATVDYAILLCSEFKKEAELEKDSVKSAAIAAYRSVGSVIRSACVFFSATFAVYLLSDMPLIKSVCLLIARGSLISAAVIIIFLPSLLCITKRQGALISGLRLNTERMR